MRSLTTRNALLEFHVAAGDAQPRRREGVAADGTVVRVLTTKLRLRESTGASRPVVIGDAAATAPVTK